MTILLELGDQLNIIIIIIIIIIHELGLTKLKLFHLNYILPYNMYVC